MLLVLSETISPGLAWTPALGVIPRDVFITDVAGDDKYLLINTYWKKDDCNVCFFSFHREN